MLNRRKADASTSLQLVCPVPASSTPFCFVWGRLFPAGCQARLLVSSFRSFFLAALRGQQLLRTMSRVPHGHTLRLGAHSAITSAGKECPLRLLEPLRCGGFPILRGAGPCRGDGLVPRPPGLFFCPQISSQLACPDALANADAHPFETKGSDPHLSQVHNRTRWRALA